MSLPGVDCGAPFSLAHESAPHGTRASASAGHTTVRIELFTDDPVAVQARAVAAGSDRAQPGTRAHAFADGCSDH
jgi:hypothetical protein